MRKSVKLILTALAASLLLSAAVSTASATRLSTSNTDFRVTWARLTFAAPGGEIGCQVTLEGRFHSRTIVKVARALIGAITRAAVKQETCTGGTLAAFNGVERYNGGTPANTLPWHVTYEGFRGALPTPSGVLLLLSRFRFGQQIEPCAVQVGNETDNITGDVSLNGAGVAGTLNLVPGRNLATIIRTDRDFLGLCPRPGSRGELNGPGSVMLLGNTTSITVRLI